MATKRITPRLPVIADERLTPRQRRLLEAMRAGPRSKASKSGPLGIYLYSPDTGDLVQALGAHCRHKSLLPPRLSEFAILCTARLWRASYEWHAHAPIAEQAGVDPKTIRDLRAGRVPTTAAKDERAIFDFVTELYKTRRVSDRTYKRVHALFGDAGTVDFVAILGYYALVAMMLDVFQAMPPADAPQYFTAPAARRKH
jgi:4-carboxymuconolactone decarboxylase